VTDALHELAQWLNLTGWLFPNSKFVYLQIDIIWAIDECVHWLDSLYAWKLLDDSWKISYIPLIIP
jgi:hypothetical protein